MIVRILCRAVRKIWEAIPLKLVFATTFLALCIVGTGAMLGGPSLPVMWKNVINVSILVLAIVSVAALWHSFFRGET